MMTALFVFFFSIIDLVFSQSEYSVTLIQGIGTELGSNITRISFNRNLTVSERDSLTILPSSANVTINKTTLDVVVVQTITGEVTYFVFVTPDSGSTLPAKLHLTVLSNPGTCIHEMPYQEAL